MSYLTKEDVDGIIDTIRCERVGGLATNDLEELHALALNGLAPEARPAVIEECAQAAEHVVPRHTECGNRIAAAIRALKGMESARPEVEFSKIGILHRRRNGEVDWHQEAEVIPLGLHETLDVYMKGKTE